MSKKSMAEAAGPGPFAVYYRVGRRGVWPVLLLAALLVVCVLVAMVRPDLMFSTTVKAASGDLAADVNAFVSAIPGEGSEAYRVPTASERAAMAAAFDAVEAGDLLGAVSLAGPLGYDIVRYTDTATGRTSIMLSERRGAEGPRGWGTYLFTPGTASDAVVEVSHPAADEDTEDLGVEVFRRANARALFVAGAHHRANADGSADVDHAETSVFGAIQGAATEPSTKILQTHGFSAAEHPGYGEIVVSAGDAASSTSQAAHVHGCLRDSDFDARLYDGVSYAALGATENVQGRTARAAGASFIHVGADARLYADAVGRARLAEALSGSLR